MSTNIIEQLDAAAAPLLAARAEIQRLYADIEAHQEALGHARQEMADVAAKREADQAELAEARQQLADLVHGTSTGVPALPRQRKYMGTAYNLDGEPMTRTDREIEAHGRHCYAAGIAEGQRREKSGEAARAREAYSERRRIEDDMYADRRAGRHADAAKNACKLAALDAKAPTKS